MKIAITAFEDNLDSLISPQFCETNYFLIVDLDEVDNYKTVFNPHKKSISGSDIFGAGLIVKSGVNALITGNCSSNASRIFHSAGIEVFENMEGTVRENIMSIKEKFCDEMHLEY